MDINPYITDLYTLDTIFQKREYTEKYLTNVYSGGKDAGTFVSWHDNSAPWGLMSDEGLSGYKKSNHCYNYYLNNEVSTSDMYSYSNRWDNYYESIRKANTFLLNVDKCQEVTATQRLEWTGEALFLKATFYFELMQMFGPVPIVPDIPVDFDTPMEDLLVERNTWDECTDYVSNLLEQAIEILPYEVVDAGEIGKPTKNSAMAVLSRLTLYSASPLYNGSNSEFSSWKTNAGAPLLNPIFEIEKWAVAAANAKRLVDVKPDDLYTVQKMDNTPDLPVSESSKGIYPNGVEGIDPYHSYSDMFTCNAVLPSENKELLFIRRSTNANSSNRYASPEVVGGWGVFFIPQNLVDAYYMADGTDISNTTLTPAEDFTDNDLTFSGDRARDGFTILSNTYKQYVNREMRFYATVTFNNSYFPSTSTPPDQIDQLDGKVAKFFADSKSGKEYALNRSGGEAVEYPMTGYLCRKYIHYEDSWKSGGRQTSKYAILYRMAEVYMNYVEAMNELDKSYTINGVTVSRNTEEMKRYFNMIRYRAGLPGITDADVVNKDRMRELIARERQIEFAWEGLRYHDLRRTKKAVIYENKPVMGCNASAKKNDPQSYYTIGRVRERDWMFRMFTTRQTFFPIPKGESDKNHNLQQMLGY